MAKRFLIAVLAACILTAAAGCSGSGARFSEADLILTVDGESFNCGANITQVIETLGEGYDYAEGKSCAYDGLDKTYGYAQAVFYTHPLSVGDLVYEIYTESPKAAVSRGMTVGAARKDVTDAYGEPTKQDGGLLIYRASERAGEPALCFELEEDAVIAIFLTTEQI